MRSIFLAAVRMYVVFVAAAGYLFGQVFFGRFTFVATLIGVSGVLAGVLPQSTGQGGKHRFVRDLTLASCAAGLVGVGLDAYQYYTTLHAPGNSYPWFLVGLFALGLCAIAAAITRK